MVLSMSIKKVNTMSADIYVQMLKPRLQRSKGQKEEKKKKNKEK